LYLFVVSAESSESNLAVSIHQNLKLNVTIYITIIMIEFGLDLFLVPLMLRPPKVTSNNTVPPLRH
jgi:hypothetical protein